MKIKSGMYLKDRVGETRIVKKFLLLPKHFYGDKYWIWLEFAYIKEEIVFSTYDMECYWKEVEFVTKDEYLEYKSKNNEN